MDDGDQPVQVVQAPTGEAWGDPTDEARKQELWTRLRAWWAETDHGNKTGPFADERLTGAEVFWLAVCALAGPDANAAATITAEQLLRAATTEQRLRFAPNAPISLNLQLLCLGGVDLVGAQLQGAYLGGAQLPKANLDRADLTGANLDGANLAGTYLSGAKLLGVSLVIAQLAEAYMTFVDLTGVDLSAAQLSGTLLRWANLTDALLTEANLDGAYLSGAQLRGTDLRKAKMTGADLAEAQLEGADLSGAQLEGADLRNTSLDKQTHLDRAILSDVRLDGAIFDNTNLSVVDWSLVPILQDERAARQRQYGDETSWSEGKRGKRKSRADRKDQYQAAVRAYRRMAVALQANGLNEEASEYTYRAQVMQRRAYWYGNAYGRWTFSALLAVLAGYGYRLGRILLAYAIILVTFALAYYLTGILLPGVGEPLAWYEALLISFTAIHGRVFIGQFGLDSVYSWIAGIEAVAGIVIEGVFVAMLIQRFFSR